MTNVAHKSLAVAAALAAAAVAYPVDYLINGNFEAGPVQFGPAAGWLGQSGCALHSGFPKGNNGTLGGWFGYYTPRDLNNTAIVRQDVGLTPLPGAKYTFRSWAVGGGDNRGTAIYQIGYLIGGGFINLVTKSYPLDSSAWQPLAGVSWIAPMSRLGNELMVVQFGPAFVNGAGNNSDVWIDNAQYLEDLKPNTGNLSGTLTLEDFTPPENEAFLEIVQTPIRFELIDAQGNIAETVYTTLDNDNSFLIWTTLRGDYTLRAKARTWLSQSIPVTITNAGVTELSFSLANGDIDGDDTVTVFDYDKLSAYFDTSNTDFMFWNMQDADGIARRDADLDKDGAVTVFDYDILSQNFDRSGS